MAHEYRYPLTRVCLRGGNMTLPRTMIELFPDDGDVTIVDALTGEEHAAYMSGPRVVSGLGTLYRIHGLDVNDELLVTRLGDGRFGVTALARAGAQPEGEDGVQEDGADDETPVGAQDGARAAARAEAQAAAQDEAQDEAAAVSATDRHSLDPRLGVREAESALSELDDRGDAEVTAAAFTGSDATADSSNSAGSTEAGSTEAGSADASAAWANADAATAHDGGAAADEPASADAQPEASGDAQAEPGDAADEPWTAFTDPQQASLWDSTAPDVVPDAASDVVPDAAQAEAARPAATPPARGPVYEDEEDDAAALAAVALSSRLRRVFTRLGYRIEPVAVGVHFLHAEMGRRRYKVLVQLLRSGERLDWAGLLSRRRNSPANYLAVVGDRADLVRLSNPADLARATLWSWEALARLEELHVSVPVTPLDLESHFGRDGLFELGLKRFEEGVAARVAERGATSEVLTRLARNRAPSVFLLEELAQDVNLSRDVVLRILDRLSGAPLHLIAKVDSGEFVLRQPVDSALASLSAYAESLRQRLPASRREVFTGLDDEELGSDLLDEVTDEAGLAHDEKLDQAVSDQESTLS